MHKFPYLEKKHTPDFINKAIRQVATATPKRIKHTQAPTLGKTTRIKSWYMAPMPVHGTQAGIEGTN